MWYSWMIIMQHGGCINSSSCYSPLNCLCSSIKETWMIGAKPPCLNQKIKEEAIGMTLLPPLLDHQIRPVFFPKFIFNLWMTHSMESRQRSHSRRKWGRMFLSTRVGYQPQNPSAPLAQLELRSQFHQWDTQFLMECALDMIVRDHGFHPLVEA